MQLMSYSRPQDSNVDIHQQLKVATRCNTIALKILHKLAAVRRPNKRQIICLEMGKGQRGSSKKIRETGFSLIALITGEYSRGVGGVLVHEIERA